MVLSFLVAYSIFKQSGIGILTVWSRNFVMITRCHCLVFTLNLSWHASCFRKLVTGEAITPSPIQLINMNKNAPMLGEYVKLIKTREIVKWKSFDPKGQLVEIELPTGVVSTVQRHEIDRITANEELEFLRSRGKLNS